MAANGSPGGLAWHGFGRGSMVPRLPALCTWQGQPTAHCSCPANTNTGAALHPRARGPGWPPPYIGGGVQVLVHHGGQVVQVAGGDPFADHGGRGLCGRPHLILGGKVWGANHHLFRLGPPVHLLSVGRPHQAAGDQARADHRVPPAVQRDGGKDARAAEGRLKGAASGLEMVRALAMGVNGPAHRPERRQRRLGGRAGVRGGVGAAGGILSTAEPPVADFLKKLQQVEIPATRPLSHAEAAAKPAAALLQASHVYRRIAALGAAVRGPVRGAGEGGQVLPPSSGRPRGDGQHRPPEAASGSRAVLGGPPAGTLLPPRLRSRGGSAAASSGSCD
jgi:hypothetical protein